MALGGICCARRVTPAKQGQHYVLFTSALVVMMLFTFAFMMVGGIADQT